MLSSPPRTDLISQIVVKVNNGKSHVLSFEYRPDPSEILEQLSLRTRIPSRHLHLRNVENFQRINDANANANANDNRYSIVSFVSAYTIGILGGKGGFGTLLKGQSKMAAATRTLDFGACRDLNGRRLRHVNDEIKLRRWRQVQQAAAAANADNDNDTNNNRAVEIELDGIKTVSGIRNWHLSVPGWSEVSGKERKRGERLWRKEIQKAVDERTIQQKRKDAIKQDRERVIRDYAKPAIATATTTTLTHNNNHATATQNMANTNTMGSAIAEGMRKRRKLGTKQHQHKNKNVDKQIDKIISMSPLPYLRVLSGKMDMDIDDSIHTTSLPSKMTNITIQSKSLFATAAILLDKSTTMATKPSKPLYFEITILTGGISQLGWAHFVDKSYSVALSSNRDIDDNSKNSLTLFQPNSDTGDGAGDDALSYGYDGFRGLVFHKEEEIPYGRKAEDEDGSNGQPWKEGDVVGCLYDICKGTVQYFLNGEDLGIAFTLKSPIPSTVGTRCNNKQNTFPHLFPVFSMDQDEIISANIGPKFKFTPTSSNKSCDIMGICDLVNTGAVVGRTEECSVEVIKELKTTSTIRQGQQSELISSPDVPTGVPSNCSVVGASLDMKVPPSYTMNEEPSSSYKASVLNKKSTPKGSTPKKQDSKKNNETKEVNLEDIQSVEELKELGMDRLKEGLFALGCKCGGTLEERAERLFLIKGMGKKDYPMKVRGKNFVL